MNNQPRLCKKQNYIQFHNKNKFKTPSLAVGLTEGPPGPERAVETPPSSSTRGVSAVSTAPTLLPPPPPSPSSPSSSSWGHQVPSTVRAGENTLHGRVFEPATSAAAGGSPRPRCLRAAARRAGARWRRPAALLRPPRAATGEHVSSRSSRTCGGAKLLITGDALRSLLAAAIS